MNALFVAVLASLAVFASSSIIHGGAIVSGPAGIVTSSDHGLGLEQGLNLGHSGILAAPALVSGHALTLENSEVLATPVVGHEISHGYAGLGLRGVGHGLGLGVASHGLTAITNGVGSIGVSGHGAVVQGPKTAPVVVSGPSGKIVADGLWGPTANIGQTGGHGW